MTYKTLDTIPYKLFLKIAETDNVSLLSDSEVDIDVLSKIWESLYEEHLENNKSPEAERIFSISKEIEILKLKYNVVILSCAALHFDYDHEVYKILIGLGFEVNNQISEEYYRDIEQIERQAGAYLIKINRLKEQLPVANEENKYNIDDVMASYSSILGFDFDYNKVSYSKYYALQSQVNSKIKSIKEKQPKNV